MNGTSGAPLPATGPPPRTTASRPATTKTLTSNEGPNRTDLVGDRGDPDRQPGGEREGRVGAPSTGRRGFGLPPRLHDTDVQQGGARRHGCRRSALCTGVDRRHAVAKGHVATQVARHPGEASTDHPHGDTSP